MKSKKIDDNTLEFTYSNIFLPVIFSLIFLTAGGWMVQKGLSGDWQGGGDDTVFAAVGAVVLIVALILIIFGPIVNTFRFEKNRNQIFQKKRRTFGLKEHTYSLDEVNHILVRKHIRRRSNSSGSHSAGKRRVKITYSYHLVFNDHRQVKMARRGERIGFISGSVVPDAVADVANFLDVPIEKPAGIGEVVNQVKTAFQGVVSAIKEEKSKQT